MGKSTRWGRYLAQKHPEVVEAAQKAVQRAAESGVITGWRDLHHDAIQAVGRVLRGGREDRDVLTAARLAVERVGARWRRKSTGTPRTTAGT